MNWHSRKMHSISSSDKGPNSRKISKIHRRPEYTQVEPPKLEIVTPCP